MKIGVIGTGGVGGYFGARLAQAGNDVTFIARGEHLKAIQENGLQVNSIKGDFTIKQAKATDNILSLSKPELIILGVKAWQVNDIAPKLKQIISENTIILPLQNGILAVEDLTKYIDRSHILCALCRIFSKIEAPGVIAHTGIEPQILFGELDNSKSHRITKLTSVFTEAGIDSYNPKDVQSELWKKFISICTSGLLAVCRSTYGEVREFTPTRQLMQQLLSEIVEIAKKEQVALKPDLVERMMEFIDSFGYNTQSSLTRDVLEGRPSEIEYQNGTVVMLAKKHGIEVPVNNMIYSCIKLMEKNNSKK